MKSSKLYSRNTGLTLICLFALLTAGCSTTSTSPQSESPWKADIDATREHTTEYQRAILADYLVTDAEFFEAQERMLSCVHAHGIEYRIDRQYGRSGSFNNPNYSEQEHDQLISACEQEYFLFVEIYHMQMRMNPDNEDPWEIFTECVQKKGLVDRSYTAGSLQEAVASNVIPSSTQLHPDWQRCNNNPKDLPELRDYAESLID